MDGVSWSTSRAPESFSRSRTAADTLSRLASFIARVDSKPPPHAQNQKPPPPHLLSSFVCPECGKDFPYATELLHHQEAEHSLPKPHRCPSCGREFSLRSSLTLHRCSRDSSPCERCHGDPRPGSPCPACTIRISDPGGLRDRSPHRQPRPYACAPCGRGFSQKQALLHHQQAGCGEAPPPRDAGAEDSPRGSEGDFTQSDSSEAPGPSGGPDHEGRSCSKMFRSDNRLHRHRQSRHTEQRLRRQNTGGQGGALRAAGRSQLNGDQVKMPKSKQQLLSCRSCDLVFRSTSKLLLHRKDKHSREKNTLREWPVISRVRRAGSYPCPVCSKVFLHHLSLRAHCRQHTASCSATGSGGTTNDSQETEHKPDPAAEHQTVPAGLERSREAVRPESKTDHPEAEEEEEQEEEEEEQEQEQEQEEEFPCPSCAEVFSLQWQLKEHVELHQSAVKRRRCSLCTADMDTRKWPASRRRRLYHCGPCQQGFSALDSFLQHCQKHLRVRVEQDRITEASRA